jgi:uncharacterized protein
MLVRIILINENNMAIWDKISSRGNVQDRRGMSPLAIGGGGLGLTGLALIIILNLLGGGDLGDVLSQVSKGQVSSVNINSQEFEGEDNYEVFVSTVLGSANDAWENVFNQNNLTYLEPKLVLFRSATQSSCGIASSASGPHYCPNDETIYLDETFFDELRNRLGAQGGDVAEAYVIAHEVGHHVQKQLGVFDEVDNSDNEQSIKVELQADCFAGIWANSIRYAGVFEDGEINEALDAAAAVGDDRIQNATQGSVHPETWTHGSSEQRVAWFRKGYDTGKASDCNTF